MSEASIEPLRRVVEAEDYEGLPNTPGREAIAAYDNLKQRAESLEMCLRECCEAMSWFVHDDKCFHSLTHARTVLSENTKEEK